MKLKELRKELGLSQAKLAEQIGIAQNTLSQYETSMRQPDNETLLKLADFFDVTVDYLLGRDGDNYSYVDLPKEEVLVPVLGSVPCGTPIEAVENILGYEYIPKSWTKGGKQYFGLYIKGDSMYPYYLEGDIAIICKQSDFDSGNDCLVYVNSDYEGTLKRVYKTDNGLQLVPLNTNYSPMSYTEEEVSKLPIVIGGIVIELRRKFKKPE